MAGIRAYVIVAIAACFGSGNGAQYLGKFLGKLSELHHGVSGEVYAVDGRTLHIKDFTYDGQGPAAYFYASTYKTADSRGFRLRDENNNGEVIRRYRKEGVTITLPEGKTLSSIKIFYVWCEEFDVNFGDVKISQGFDFPRPQKIDALKGVHSISSDNIVIVDAQTLLIPNLYYDGEAPDAKFWVGRGPKPSPQGIRVPDENGKEVPLRRYNGKTVVLTLPGDLTVFDIGHFGIWCEQFTVDFGHIQIPQTLNVPPSLKMLGVSPQSKLNCEVLNEDLAFEVRWAVAGESIVLQLVAKLDGNEYMSFGVSGDDSKSVMIGGDVAVAWVDKETLKGYAQDYYLADKSQCSGPTGSCPDLRFRENTENIRLLNAALVNGYSIVTFQRPLKMSDEYDKPIYTNGSQAIIWAVGPLNQRNEVSFHTSYLKTDSFIEFARPAKWNCPLPEGEQPKTSTSLDNITEEKVAEPAQPSTTSKIRNNERRRGSNRGTSTRQPITNIDDSENANTKQHTRTRGPTRGTQKTSRVPPPTPVKHIKSWDIPAIQCDEPDDGVFYAQMGPTGGKRGYPAITGHVGWGISWYINGLLIPEIHVVRGQTYTFVVEGGKDPEIPAKYHPFYITDDSVGGYTYKTQEERKNVSIFAGAQTSKDGTVYPTGTGRLCHWTETSDVDADDYESFGAYQRTLELICDPGEPGVIQWTPDNDTPDTVYYQCFSHRYLGWKIHVHDSCDTKTAASELKPTIVASPTHTFDSFSDQTEAELETSPPASVPAVTRVNENNIEDVIKTDKPYQITVLEQTTDPTSVDPRPASDPPQEPSPHQNDSLHQINTTMQSHISRVAPPNFRPSPTLEVSLEELHAFGTFSTTTPPQRVAQGYIIAPPLHSKPFQNKPLFHTHAPVRPSPPRRHLSSNPAKQPYFKATHPTRYVKPHNTKPLPKVIALNPVTKSPPIILSSPRTAGVSETDLLVKDIEISPIQASTEREPNVPAPSYLLSISNSSADVLRLPLAKNSGFKPETIVIESGFKPIIGKVIENRNDNDRIDLELNPEGQTGIIATKGKKVIPIDSFEPIFIPSPTDKSSKSPKTSKRPLKKHALKIIFRTRRLVDPNFEPGMAASERTDSYYLPPPGHTEKPKIFDPKQPSNIDVASPSGMELAASPPDVVVTYDGKKVSGASLTAKIFDKSRLFEQTGSKATEFIKARPQFGPFRGELPPLGSDVLFDGKEPYHRTPKAGVLSRELDTPLPPPPGSSSTRLTRVERSAHHNPEHTAQQSVFNNW